MPTLYVLPELVLALWSLPQPAKTPAARSVAAPREKSFIFLENLASFIKNPPLL